MALLTRPLTEKQKKFIEVCAKSYVQQGKGVKRLSLIECYNLAGYQGTQYVNAYHLYKKFKTEIESMREEMIAVNNSALMAQEIIIGIAQDEDANPAVRLKAAQDIMSRAGYDGKTKISIEKSESEMSDEELNKEIESLVVSSDNVEPINKSG